MSKAMKCDRCGRYFENQSLAEDQVICATVDMFGNVKVERHVLWQGTIEHECCCTAKLIDLCPDCLDSFGDWFNGHAGEGEDDG